MVLFTRFVYHMVLFTRLFTTMVLFTWLFTTMVLFTWLFTTMPCGIADQFTNCLSPVRCTVWCCLLALVLFTTMVSCHMI